MKTGRPSILSVVIPTYRRDDDLERCLRSLRENSRGFPEIIVLAPELPPRTRRACELYSARGVEDGSRSNGKRVKGLWQIINRGIELAENEFVCWLNDDCTVNPGWDTAAVSYFTDGVGLVVLKTLGINGNPEYQVRPGHYGIPCANYAIIRKSAGIRFDESYNWFYGDADISLQVARWTDLRVVGTSEDLVIHAHRKDENRRENEEDPRTAADHAYFSRKWSYKKRHGDFLRDMNWMETSWAFFLDLLRSLRQAARRLGERSRAGASRQ